SGSTTRSPRLARLLPPEPEGGDPASRPFPARPSSASFSSKGSVLLSPLSRPPESSLSRSSAPSPWTPHLHHQELPMSVTPAMIKELRERSGAGFMDCKAALTETNGDIDAAIEMLRKKGLASAAKKAGRVAAEG